MAITELVSMSINNNNESFSDRIEMLLTQRGCSKAWLARELGITRQALHQILNQNKRPKFISEIALALNVNPKWLQTGEGKIQTGTKTIQEKTFLVNVYAFSELQKTLSINKTTPIDQITVQPHEKYNYFAIQLKSYPSMSDKFPEGTVLIFEAKSVAKNEDYVLAKKNKTILFRQYFFEQDTAILRPINEGFKTIAMPKDQCDILGILREKRIRF